MKVKIGIKLCKISSGTQDARLAINSNALFCTCGLAECLMQSMSKSARTADWYSSVSDCCWAELADAINTK
jgi:hypothetical protein